MKTSLLVFGLIVGLAGCDAAKMFTKQAQASIAGLNRTITLYSADGKVLERWNIKTAVQTQGGTCYFLDGLGRAVIISGTFYIQENSIPAK